MNGPRKIAFSSGIGTVAAYHTGIEFVIGLVGVSMLSMFLYGLWIVKLHFIGKISLKKSEVKWRLLRREFLVLLFTAWMVSAVAILENSLDNELLVTGNEYESNNCARLDMFYSASIWEFMMHPAHRYAIDYWSLNVGKMIGCEKGLLSVGFKDNREDITDDDQYDFKKRIDPAPSCINSSTVQDRFMPGFSQAKLDLKTLLIFNLGITPLDPFITVLPYQGNVGRSRYVATSKSETYQSCLLYTSPSPRDQRGSRMPSSA